MDWSVQRWQRVAKKFVGVAEWLHKLQRSMCSVSPEIVMRLFLTGCESFLSCNGRHLLYQAGLAFAVLGFQYADKNLRT